MNSTDDQSDADPTDGTCSTGDMVGGEPECTLRAAVQEGNDDGQDVTINVPSGTYVLTMGQIDVTNPDWAISIVGAGTDATIIDGNEASRIFGVSVDADLTLDGVTLTNGSTTTDGGAIDNQGALTVSNSVFSNNTVDGDNGGALNNDGAATLTSTTFTGNTTIGDTSDGGAIYNNEATLTISDSVFDGNTGGDDAGAIENDSDLTITNTVFRNNENLDNDGGAIDNDSSANLSITGSVFENNTSFDDGGAIDHSASGDVTISSTEFRSNTAGTDGGAIVSDDAPVTIADSTFAENTSADHGGGIHTEVGGTTQIDGSTFENNEAGPDLGDSGGAIYNAGGEGVAILAVSNSTFRGNVAPGDDSYGGAIENDFGQADIRSSTLVGNDAHEGGGLSSRGGFVTVTNTTISGNTADEGAGVYAGVVASMNLEHVTIARNTASIQGGGIHNPDSEINVGHTLIAENEPQNCSGTGLGSRGHNVTDDDSCTLLFDGESGDQTGVSDAHITDLGDYGGDTQVHALLSESPAIDVAESGETREVCEDAEGATLEEDQRGAPRPVDGDGSGTAFCDAGAFEFIPPDSLTLAPADATNDVGTAHTVTATVTDTLEAPSESITVRFSVDGANTASGTAVTDPDGQADFTYTGSNAGDDTISAYADTNGNETQDDGEPSGTAAKTWEAADETPRLSGDDRFLTAIDISQDSFADGAAGAVVLARDDVFADALSGTPFAVQEDAPLLLTQTSALRPEVADEIERVLPDGSTVYLLGGEQALSQDVADQVAALGYVVERVEGIDRFETAVEIAGELGDPDTLLVATGFDFVDALTAGPAAIAADAAVLLTHEDTMTPTTQSYLDGRDGLFVYAVGGPDVNPYADSGEVDESVYGGDRFETAVAVADEFFDAPVEVGVARSDVFADALTGGVHIGRLGGPMLVTPPTSLQGDIEGYLCTNAGSIGTAYVYGGVVAISQTTADTIADRVNGQGC